MKLTSKQLALISVFAGFYYLFSFLPGIPAPGISAVTIQLSATMATIFGFILGPYLGASTAFIGGLVSWALPPGSRAVTDLIFIPSPILNALVSGFLFKRQWKPAAACLGALIVAFWLTPPVQPIAEYWYVGIAVTFDKIIAFALIGLIVFLDRKIQRTKPIENQPIQKMSKPILSFTIFTLSSILLLVNNSLVAVNGSILSYGSGDLQIAFGYEPVIDTLGTLNILWVAVALIALLASIMLFLKPNRRRILAVTVVSCSLLSVFTGGGFIIGVVLAVVSGFFIFFGDVFSYETKPKLEVFRLFIIAFVGNETDNIWGSLVFSLPIIYQSLYGLNTSIVQDLFLISPFAYPIIRFLQAIIATMVAVPLIRTLKAAKLILIS